MRLPRRSAALTFAFVLCASVLAAAPPPPGRGGRGGQARPAREAAPAVPDGTGTIAGKVVAAETARPVKRARIVATGGGRPFTTTTDDQGRYRLTALPAATFTITASKTGYVNAVYGQRRALAAGTPVELADAQQADGIDLRLTRGGVIAGRVLDEDGEPLAQAIVTVHRHQYVGGERQMTPAGVDQSDDRGQFRVFGLPPGSYSVSANAGGVERLVQQLLPQALGQARETSEPTGYAATYYPGVIAPSEAARIQLAPAQEITSIEFQLQIVALATVRGVVSGGAPATVMLLPEGSAGAPGGRGGGGGRGGMGGIGAVLGGAIGGALRGAQLRANAREDGSFTIPNVTPGKYTIVARSGEGPGAATAMQPLLVAGEEVNVVLAPAPGVELSGTVTLESASTTLPRVTGFRVTATPVGAAAALPRGSRPAQANERGEFTMTDVFAGQYLIGGGAPQGWTMKSVYVDGRDVTDRPIEVKGSAVGGVNVIFTDRVTSLAGTVRDRAGAAPPGLTVIAFAADEAQWHGQSRYIRTARTDNSGRYRLTGLPPAEYLLAVVDDVDQGEWFDPAFLEALKGSAVKVQLDEGEQKTQDLKMSASGSPASRLF